MGIEIRGPLFPHMAFLILGSVPDQVHIQSHLEINAKPRKIHDIEQGLKHVSSVLIYGQKVWCHSGWGFDFVLNLSADIKVIPRKIALIPLDATIFPQLEMVQDLPCYTGQ